MASGGTRVIGAPTRSRAERPSAQRFSTDERPGTGHLHSAPARDATEQVLVRLRRSGRRLVWPSLLFIAICGATGYFWRRLPADWMNTALPIVAAALVVLLCFMPLITWANRVTLITTRRLIVKQGFVVRQRTEFVLGRGAQVTVRRNALQLLAGGGDVIVHAGAAGTMILRDVPRPKLVRRAVSDLIDTAVGTASMRPTTRRPFVN